MLIITSSWSAHSDDFCQRFETNFQAGNLILGSGEIATMGIGLGLV